MISLLTFRRKKNVNILLVCCTGSPLYEEYMPLVNVSTWDIICSPNSLLAGSWKFSTHQESWLPFQLTQINVQSWCIFLTLGNRDGPSKLASIYLIKSRLSPKTLPLCSNDGTYNIRRACYNPSTKSNSSLQLKYW